MLVTYCMHLHSVVVRKLRHVAEKVFEGLKVVFDLKRHKICDFNLNIMDLSLSDPFLQSMPACTAGLAKYFFHPTFQPFRKKFRRLLSFQM